MWLDSIEGRRPGGWFSSPPSTHLSYLFQSLRGFGCVLTASISDQPSHFSGLYIVISPTNCVESFSSSSLAPNLGKPQSPPPLLGRFWRNQGRDFPSPSSVSPAGGAPGPGARRRPLSRPLPVKCHGHVPSRKKGLHGGRPDPDQRMDGSHPEPHGYPWLSAGFRGDHNEGGRVGSFGVREFSGSLHLVVVVMKMTMTTTMMMMIPPLSLSSQLGDWQSSAALYQNIVNASKVPYTDPHTYNAHTAHFVFAPLIYCWTISSLSRPWALTLSLPRVINVKFLLQPHQ